MSRWAQTLVTTEPTPRLDLLDYVGQRTATYRFELVDIVTGYRQVVHPLSSSVPTLSHDVSRTITRRLDNLIFNPPTSDLIDVIRSRIDIFMVLDGIDYPLGRYMYNNETIIEFTSGDVSSGALYDEGFIVDQRIPESFSSVVSAAGVVLPNDERRIRTVIQNLLSSLPITLDLASSEFFSASGWPAGTSRGFIVEQLALDGDYFSPWFGNDQHMHFIRSFDPATVTPTFDLDSGNRVLRERIFKTNDLIDAPNEFVVVSNGVDAQSAEVVGRYFVPASAPHSVPNRGFVIPFIDDRQVTTLEQADAVARNLGQRFTIFERIELYTAPDPRHDGYDVLRWRGDNWLELSWSLPLVEGAAMQHVARKAYVA